MCQMRAANVMYLNACTILRATNSPQLITRNQLRATSSATVYVNHSFKQSYSKLVAFRLFVLNGENNCSEGE